MHAPDLADYDFLMRHVIGGHPLGAGTQDLDLATRSLEQMARLSRDMIDPLAVMLDRTGCKFENGRVSVPSEFKAAFDQFATHGWLGASLPEKWGGSGLSELTQTAISEIVNGACVPFGMLALLTRAGTRTLLEHAPPELRDAVVPRLLDGQWTATICMTEPNAGSDARLMTTAAIPLGNGTYAISGTKIFISFGDHDITDQIVHIVLARISGNTKSLSLFLVPKFKLDDGRQNGVNTLRIESKLGLHGSPTCVIELDGAIGYPLGSAGQGLQSIFTMVNTMRLEVAVQGIALASRAAAAAWRYASERIQGSDTMQRPVTINRHPDIQHMLMAMRTQTEGMRALVFQVAALVDQSHASSSVNRDAAAALVAWLLPICKAASSEMAVAVTNLAIQVHGGHGYMKDHPVERYLRDARILPIYEGTTGIQAIDLVLRKLRKNQRREYKVFCDAILRDLEDTAPAPEYSDIRNAVLVTVDILQAETDRIADFAETDALAAATPYLMLNALAATGWMWLRMAKAKGADKQDLAAKQTLARFYAGDLVVSAQYLAAKIQRGAKGLPLPEDLERTSIAARA